MPPPSVWIGSPSAARTTFAGRACRRHRPDWACCGGLRRVCGHQLRWREQKAPGPPSFRRVPRTRSREPELRLVASAPLVELTAENPQDVGIDMPVTIEVNVALECALALETNPQHQVDVRPGGRHGGEPRIKAMPRISAENPPDVQRQQSVCNDGG